MVRTSTRRPSNESRFLYTYALRGPSPYLVHLLQTPFMGATSPVVCMGIAAVIKVGLEPTASCMSSKCSRH